MPIEIHPIPSIHEMMTHVFNIKKAVEERFVLDKADEQTENSTNALYDIGIQIVKGEVLGFDTGETPLLVPLHLVQIMKEPNIRCCDSLQNSLSKACRVFSEIILFKSFRDERKIANDYKDNLVSSIDYISKTIPTKEIDTRFQLRAASNAVKSITAATGLFRTYFLPTVYESATVIASKTTLPKVTDFSKPFTGFIKACFEMHQKESVEGWFRECFDWSWLATLSVSKEDFNTLSDIKKHYKKDQDFAFCALEALIKIIKNPEVNSDLKKDLISSEELSLCSLSSLKKLGTSFWEVRYLSTKHLIDLLSDSNYRDLCIKQLALNLTKESRPKVSALIKNACQNATEKSAWKKVFKNLNLKKASEEAKKFLKEEYDQSESGFKQQANEGDYGEALDYQEKSNIDLENLKAIYEQNTSCLDENKAFIEQLLEES